jgi:carbonic anhydrase
VSGAADLRMMQGNDAAILDGCSVAAGLALRGKAGKDIFYLNEVEVGGRTWLHLGQSRDAVALIDSQFNKAFAAFLGRGGDQLSVEGSTFQRHFTLRGTNRLQQITEQFRSLNTFEGLVRKGLVRATLDRVEDVHWGYEGLLGPAFWDELTPSYLFTWIGWDQSPINLVTGSLFALDLPDINFDYELQHDLPFIHNGHTVEVEVEPGSAIDIPGGGLPCACAPDPAGPMELVQFHFHTPSEHLVDDAAFDLELHLVHRDSSGRLAVVGVLITSGAANPAYDAIVANLPTIDDPDKVIPGSFDVTALLPADRQVYRYEGSLTTPPGSEGVVWSVFTTPVELAPAQITAIAGAIGSSNARPVQPVNDRPVLVDVT